MGLIQAIGKILKLGLLNIILSILIAMLIFTGLDFLFHNYFPKSILGFATEFSVPSLYFFNKILFGSIVGLLAYFPVRLIFLKKPMMARTVWILIIIGFLQFRYLFFPAPVGYPHLESLSFNILNLIVHYFTLLIGTLISGLRFGGFNIKQRLFGGQ